MSRKALENTNEMCSCSLGILSYNTPKIELIQYGRRIGKRSIFICLVRRSTVWHLV